MAASDLEPVAPPLDGSFAVLPGLVDFHAAHNPARPWARLAPPPERGGGGGAAEVSFQQFADATHRIAHAFRPDGTHARGEVVAVLVHTDAVLYLALLVGLIRAGFLPFPMSPRNAPPALAHMFDKTACRRVIAQDDFAGLLGALRVHLRRAGADLRVDRLPDVWEVFPDLARAGTTAARAAPFPPSPRPLCMTDDVIYLHSSGSTGFPKPITLNQYQTVEWCRSPCMSAAAKHGVHWGSMPLPTYHTIGIYMQLFAPLAGGYAVCLYYPTAPAPPPVPTPANVLDACRATGATGINIVPAFLEAWALDEDHVAYLQTLDILCYAGGPLSKKNGDRLVAAGVNLHTIYGGTEYAVHTNIFDIDRSPRAPPGAKTPDDWEWVSFADNVRARWAPQGDGSFEYQCLTHELHHPSLENLPDVNGYATHDLFVPHPTKPNLWRLIGRKDDVIVLSTGMNVVPIPQEGVINASPLVGGAVMFGRGRTQCGLLVEPKPGHEIDVNDDAHLAEFRNTIWHVVEEANHLAPTFARLFKEMIVVTDPARPLPRAGKGTITRRQAYATYEKEIDRLYQTIADSADTKGIAPPRTWAVPDIERWLLAHAASLKHHQALSPVKSVFEQGFDSLHATFLRNRIAATLRGSAEPEVQHASLRVTQNFIFEHPTLQGLAETLAVMISQEP